MALKTKIKNQISNGLIRKQWIFTICMQDKSIATLKIVYPDQEKSPKVTWEGGGEVTTQSIILVSMITTLPQNLKKLKNRDYTQYKTSPFF